MLNKFSESRLYSQEIQPIVSLHCLAIFLALKSDLCRYVSRWRCRDFVWIIDTPGRSWHQKRNIKTPRLNRSTVRPTQRIQSWDTENGKKRRKAPKAPKQCKAQQILRHNHKISPFFCFREPHFQSLKKESTNDVEILKATSHCSHCWPKTKIVVKVDPWEVWRSESR